MRRLRKRLDRLEARVRPDRFMLDSDGFRFVCHGGGVMVLPTPVSVEDWLEQQRRISDKPAREPQTREEIVESQRVYVERMVAAAAKVGLTMMLGDNG